MANFHSFLYVYQRVDIDDMGRYGGGSKTPSKRLVYVTLYHKSIHFYQ